MKKINWRIATLVAILLIGAGYFAYHQNWLNTKNEVVKYQVTHRTVTSKNKISANKRQQIVDKMMTQTETKVGLTKQGFVSMPSLGILQPIFNDAYSKTGLDEGANYANKSAVDPDGNNIPVMGKSNYGLASHNFNDGKTGFSALQEDLNNDSPYLVNGKLQGSNWLNGRFIYLANGDKIFRYTITGQTLVYKDDVAVLNPTKHAKLTIISCLFPSTDYRIITHAKLTKTWGWQKAPDKIVNYFDLSVQKTNAHASWFNPGEEEGVN